MDDVTTSFPGNWTTEELMGNSSINATAKPEVYWWIQSWIKKLPYLEPLFLYGIGGCMFLGTLSNLLLIAVLCRKKLRENSTSCYLIALGVFDTFVLWNYNSTDWYEWTTGSVLVPWPCNWQWFAVIFCTAVSSYLVVAVTFERLIAVMYPLHASNILKRRYAIIVTILITVSLGLLCIPMVLTQTWDVDREPKCMTAPGWEFFQRRVKQIYEFVLRILIPDVFLIVMNAAIIITLRRSGLKLSEGQSAQSAARAKNMRNITITVIVISLAQVVFAAPYAVFRIISSYTDMGTKVSRQYGNYITSLCAYINHCCNFYLYILSSRNFRTELVRMLTFGRYPKDPTVKATRGKTKMTSLSSDKEKVGVVNPALVPE